MLLLFHFVGVRVQHVVDLINFIFGWLFSHLIVLAKLSLYKGNRNAHINRRIFNNCSVVLLECNNVILGL